MSPAEEQTILREEFGVTHTQSHAETAAVAVEAHAKAAIQSRYVMAIQRPRNMDQVRHKLLLEDHVAGLLVALHEIAGQSAMAARSGAAPSHSKKDRCAARPTA